ncbi:hypothetical protein ACHAXS_001625, partial [Conticribra weissflogii]
SVLSIASPTANFNATTSSGAHPHPPPAPHPIRLGSAPSPHLRYSPRHRGPLPSCRIMSRWRCDVCNIATFPTFDEALEHEQQCNGVSWDQPGFHNAKDEGDNKPTSRTNSAEEKDSANDSLSEFGAAARAQPSVSAGTPKRSRADAEKHLSTDGNVNDNITTTNNTGPSVILYRKPRWARWFCDYCRVAVFDDYDVCAEHEEQCADNPNNAGIIDAPSSKRAKMTFDDEVGVVDEADSRFDGPEKLKSELSSPTLNTDLSNKRNALAEGANNDLNDIEDNDPDDIQKPKKIKHRNSTLCDGRPLNSGHDATNESLEKPFQSVEMVKVVINDEKFSNSSVGKERIEVGTEAGEKQGPGRTRVGTNDEGTNITDFDVKATTERGSSSLPSTETAEMMTEQQQQQTFTCDERPHIDTPAESNKGQQEISNTHNSRSSKHSVGNEKLDGQIHRVSCMSEFETRCKGSSQLIKVMRSETANNISCNSAGDELRPTHLESKSNSLEEDGGAGPGSWNRVHQLEANEDLTITNYPGYVYSQPISSYGHRVPSNYHNSPSETKISLKSSSNVNAGTAKPSTQNQQRQSDSMNNEMAEQKSFGDNSSSTSFGGLEIPGSNNFGNPPNGSLKSFNLGEVESANNSVFKHQEILINEDEVSDQLGRISELEGAETVIQPVVRSNVVKSWFLGKFLLLVLAVITIILCNVQSIVSNAPLFGTLTIGLTVLLLLCNSSSTLAVLVTHEGAHHRHIRGFASDLVNTMQLYFMRSYSHSQTSDNITTVTLREYLSHPDGFHASFAPAFFGFFCYFGCLTGLEEETGGWIVPAPPSTNGSFKDCRLKSVAGASAGAMAAVMLAAGIQPRKAAEFSSRITWKAVADPPGIGGFVKGERFEQIMREFILENAQIVRNPHENPNEIDFVKSIHLEEALIPVAVSGFDLFRMKGKLISHGCMAKAARSSACFPGLFAPVPWSEDCKDSEESKLLPDSLLIDGGVTDGLGLWGLSATPSPPDKRKRVINFVVGDFGYKGASGIAEMPDGIDVESLVSIAIMNTPLCGPWAMENGPKAVEAARRAIIAALDIPMERGTCDNHYV